MMRHEPRPSGTMAPAQKPNWNTSDMLPKDELPSTACAASMVPTMTSGRLLPAMMSLLPLFWTNLEDIIPTARVMAIKMPTAMP